MKMKNRSGRKETNRSNRRHVNKFRIDVNILNI